MRTSSPPLPPRAPQRAALAPATGLFAALLGADADFLYAAIDVAGQGAGGGLPAQYAVELDVDHLTEQ